MSKLSSGGKKILIAILAVTVLAIVYWFVVKNNQKPVPAVNNQQNSSMVEDITAPKFEYAPADKSPTGFPASVPIEKDAKITENNFSALTAESKAVAVREFISKYSLPENYQLYKKYLTDSGYVLEDDVSQDDQKIVSGTKDGYRLRVRIYKFDQEVRVTINYVQM